MRFFRLTLLVLLPVVFAPVAHPELANAVRAIVNDSVITVQQVDSLAAKAVELLRRQYADQPELFHKKYLETVNDATEELVRRQLILHEFETAGYKIPESALEESVQERIRDRFGDRATLTKTLQAEHLTYETFRKQIREQIIIEAMRGKNVSSEVIISPQKIETFYKEHREEFKVEDQIKLRMIVLDSSAGETAEARKKLGEQILAKIDEGAAFSEIAAIYSTGSQRNQGGDWGWIERSVLRKELAEAAFSLPVGKRSGVIESPEACYIMLVEEVRPAHTRALGEIRDDIEKTLRAQERARLEKTWIDQLKKKTFVRYF
jgi:peptidyl-prolyl cis-trans isomerase SurA